MYYSIITVRNSSCGKVMFPQECVKNSVHGGVSASGSRGVYTPLGRHPPRQTPETPTAADGTHFYWNAFLLLIV